MPVEAAVFLQALKDLLSWFQKNRMHQDAQKDAALEAIHKALLASMQYAEEQRDLNLSNRVREFELAELWANAAVKVRSVSKDLAIRLQDKSVFWSAQIKWSKEEVLLKRIDFVAIQDELKLLMREP